MTLDEVIPWGRSFDEYRRMFTLTDRDLLGPILGVGDGPASFNAEATAMGHSVTSADPLYAFSADDIRRRIDGCYGTVVEQARKDAHRYVWDEFAAADALGAARRAAMDRFLADYDRGRAEGRYVAASLPDLPFRSGQFNLCLCSHLLFLYSSRLDLAFHVESIRSMLHVALEVRVFPLVDLDGRPSPHVQPLMEALRAGGWEPEIRPVDYEFQRGANQMLRVLAEG